MVKLKAQATCDEPWCSAQVEYYAEVRVVSATEGDSYGSRETWEISIAPPERWASSLGFDGPRHTCPACQGLRK
jgi:hypothetical protein